MTKFYIYIQPICSCGYVMDKENDPEKICYCSNPCCDEYNIKYEQPVLELSKVKAEDGVNG